jgi:hypothetical protein
MIRRALAIAVSAGVLAVQLWRVALVGADSGWYWPFMDYPMYSEPHRYTETIVQRQMRGLPCRGGEPVALHPDTLRAPRFLFWFLLADVAGASAAAARDPAVADSSRRLLTEIVRSGGDGRFCQVQLWEERHRFGPSGLLDRPQQVLLSEWPVPARGGVAAGGIAR